MEYDCRNCKTLTAVPFGMEPPKHGLCWPCSSDEVTRLLGVLSDRSKNCQERVDRWVETADKERERAEAAELRGHDLQVKLTKVRNALKGFVDEECHCPETTVPCVQCEARAALEFSEPEPSKRERNS